MSRQELADIRAILHGEPADPRLYGVTFAYYFDAEPGQAVIETHDPPPFESLRDAFPGRISIQNGGSIDRISRTNDGAPHWGGAGVAGVDYLGHHEGACTTAFTIDSSQTGHRHLVTAGHCFNEGDNVWASGNSSNSFGHVYDRKTSPGYDMESLYGSSYAGDVYVTSTSALAVYSASDPAVGGTYCYSGLITGEHCDKKVQQLDAQLCDPYPSCSYPDMIRTTGGYVPQPGDSGSPFYLKSSPNVYIRGMLIGRDTGTGETWSEKWSVIRTQFGATIVQG
jgi:hypothetical protein